MATSNIANMPSGRPLARVMRNTAVAASSRSLTDAERGGSLNSGMRDSVFGPQKRQARNLSLLSMTAELSQQSIAAALVRAATRLRPLNSAVLDAQVLLGHALGRSRSELMVRDDELIPADRMAVFEQFIGGR